MRDSNRPTLSVLMSVTVEVRSVYFIAVQRDMTQTITCRKNSLNEIPCVGGGPALSCSCPR